jgi:putative sterol carrier protein
MPDPKTSFEKEIPEQISKDPNKAKNVGAIYLFKVTGDGGGTWTVNLKDDPGVKEGDQGNAECTIELSSDDWKTISESPGQAMQLYFQGRLKVAGNAMLATKLQQILG